MKVLCVSKGKRSFGGASLVAEMSCDWLAERVGESLHLSVFQSPADASKSSGIWHEVLGMRNVVPFEYTRIRRHLKTRDIVHFHDLYGAISPFSLSLSARKMPVVFTHHDCFGFTGGCTYTMECKRHQDNCGRCPRLHSVNHGGTLLDSTSIHRTIKRRTLARAGIFHVFPSVWLRDLALSSEPRWEKHHRVIPYGVDLSNFCPPKPAKRASGSQRHPLVLIAANSLSGTRKGIAFALEAMRSIRDLSPRILLVGNTDPDTESLLMKYNFPFETTGFLDKPKEIAEAYRRADIFLFCSLADNLPLTVIETMACGTPIVGFATGGISEITVHMETGFLVPTGDQAGVNEGLRLALKNPAMLRDWSSKGVKRAKELFSKEIFVDRHLDLYEELIESFPSDGWRSKKQSSSANGNIRNSKAKP